MRAALCAAMLASAITTAGAAQDTASANYQNPWASISGSVAPQTFSMFRDD